jgi:hypothetical protein
MPLRRTKRSDGRQRPRWKDGSHLAVENTHANKSRCNEIAVNRNFPIKPLVVPQLFKQNHEHDFSTRDRPANAGADTRIEEKSVVRGKVRLALRPYGRYYSLRSSSKSAYGA